jgi:hypothetical protein
MMNVLKQMGSGGYWYELLNRIRDIRSSEKVLYRQVLDLYATSKPLTKPKQSSKNTRYKRCLPSKKTIWKILKPYRKRLTRKEATMNKIEELIQQFCPNGVEFRELGQIANITIGEFVHKNKQNINK